MANTTRRVNRQAVSVGHYADFPARHRFGGTATLVIQAFGLARRAGARRGLPAARRQSRAWTSHLASCADAALYRSKKGGKAQLNFCTAEDVVKLASAAAESRCHGRDRTRDIGA